MPGRFDHVEAFARYLADGQPVERPYFLLDPDGDHAYAFVGDPEAVRLVGSLIAGEGVKRTLGRLVLRGCAHAPRLLSAVPLVSRITLSLPAGCGVDVAVASNRTRLVDLGSAVVYTFPTDDPAGVRAEIDARRALPAGIETPELREVDPEYPYFAERFIRGGRPDSPIDGWETMLAALEGLAVLYRNREAAVSTADVLDETEALLADRGLADAEPFASALESIAELPLPETVFQAPIHGDLHTRNVVVTAETVYIVDWENYGVDYVFCDFFKPFVVSYYDTRDPAFFRELIADEGRGGEIFATYIERFGETVCSEPRHYAGLPVLYLLVELARTDRGGLWDAYRELLGAVVR